MKFQVDELMTHCHIIGGDQGPERQSVLFIHGAGQDHSVWRPIAQQIADRGYQAIAMDLPAHGASEGDPLASIEAMADWVVRLLDALSLERASLCGHSMGSLVALDCAARHSQRVAALAMVGTTAPMPVADTILDAAEADDPAAFEMLTQWGHSLTASQDLRDATLQLFKQSRPGVLFADMRACNDYAAGLERAAAVNCPTLLVLGEVDLLTPVGSTQNLQSSLPSAKISVLTGAGHMMMSEAPAALVDALDEIL